GSAHPPLQAVHRRVQGAGRRGLRRGRVTARRAGLLPRVRRQRQALPAPHPGTVVREPADVAAPAARRHGGRRGRGHLLGRPRDGRGRQVVARLSPDNVKRAEAIIARYPQPRSACIPLLHLAQEQDGHLTDEAMAHVAELLGITPAEVLGTASFYEMFRREDTGRYLIGVCTNIACLLLGGYELLEP